MLARANALGSMMCGLAVACAGLAAPSGARAEAAMRIPVAPSTLLSAAQLTAKAELLRSPEPGLRAETAHVLSHLDSDSRAGVVDRLRDLATQRPTADEVARTFAALRRASGARSSDEDVDLALAIPALLQHDRSARALAVVEPLLYLRSLENFAAAEGHLDLALFVDLDGGAWENELKQVRKRLGASFVPALLSFRAHESARVRKFATAQLEALGMLDPKLVLSHGDPHVLARALRAYASPPDFAAMPAIVRMVSDSRLQVRQAARAAVARFGKNAIWQVRELYEEVSGQPADKRWDHERTARELYAVVDRPRTEEADTLLATGRAALADGDLDAMQANYDALLAKYPDLEQRDQLAPGYASLAERLFQRDALDAALAAYRRALRLAPNAPDAQRWQARVAFVSGELALTRGVVDLISYARALELDPELTEARDAIDRLSGTRSQHVRDMKRRAAFGAFVLLLTCVVLMLRRTRSTDRALAHAELSPPAKSEADRSTSL